MTPHAICPTDFYPEKVKEARAQFPYLTPLCSVRNRDSSYLGWPIMNGCCAGSFFSDNIISQSSRTLARENSENFLFLLHV